MTEDFLHFIWKYGLFNREGITTDTGEVVEITTLGEHNTNAGPDFLNARIKIGSTVWAGNVEIHLKSSDWIHHRHHEDRAYENVILHVVYRYESPVTRKTGEIVPTIILPFDNRLYDNYNELLLNKGRISCHSRIGELDRLIVDIWLHSLVIERLEDKSRHIEELLYQQKNNWEEVFYIILARTFGFGLNAIPFEMTARSLPYRILARMKDNPYQTEAAIMGQAGFLSDPELFNDYFSMLRKEYMHLKNKYNLKPVEKHLWKFLRLRPVNFPTVRLAQFSSLMTKSESLFSQVIGFNNIAELQSIFKVTAPEFWNSHYTFDTLSPVKQKHLGKEAVDIIIINAVVPFLFIYGKMTSNDNLKEKALAVLNVLEPEKNSIIRMWEKSGFIPASAFHSQGVIQLVKTYCSRKRCLACSIGTMVIRS